MVSLVISITPGLDPQDNSASVSGTISIVINDTIEGIRISFDDSEGSGADSISDKLYTLEYGPMNGTGTITHTIPSGSFSSTISSSFMTALVADWEDGANVQYKLTGTGGTEDSGWLDYNTVQTFTAFTAEPDTLIVRLVPKTTSPTSGYPSIKGVAVYE